MNCGATSTILVLINSVSAKIIDKTLCDEEDLTYMLTKPTLDRQN
jgi:hypothetical protein